MLRMKGVKNIPAALRHYGWKPWETLTLIGLLPNIKRPCVSCLRNWFSRPVKSYNDALIFPKNCVYFPAPT